MDERRARIHDDLRGTIGGDLLFEPVERAPYAIDASLHEIDPLGVVVPRTADDVVTVLRYASEHGIPIHARGAGTGRVGGALGAGLVVDFSRHMRRIEAITPEIVVAQPGVVLDDLNDRLAPFGRRLGPDPAGSESHTIGGMIGVNASGPRSLRYGSTGDHVDSLRVVLANGESAELGREPWPPYEEEAADLKGLVVRKLGMLVRRHGALLSRQEAGDVATHPGYALGAARLGAGINLARLMVGSEGTLGLVTRATLRTVPIPAAQTVLLFAFARLSDAAAVVPHCLSAAPSACDLFDWRYLSLARDIHPDYREWIVEAAEAIVVVEIEGDDPAEVARRARGLSTRLARSGRLVADPLELPRRADGERLLGLRRAVEPALLRLRGSVRPVPLIEDVAVPPEALADFLARLQNILKQQDVSWILDAHAGSGRLHTRPFLNLDDPRDVAKLEPLATQVYEAALEAGGTVGLEHGLGLAGGQFLRRHCAELVQVYREIKDAFDPHGVLNPGKVIGDDPHGLVRHLRSTGPSAGSSSTLSASGDEEGATTTVPAILPVLRWEHRGPVEIASDCNGCGACRTLEPTLRMCPTFRAQRSEAASPRAKANLIRQVASGQLDPRLWGSEALRRSADLCVHCNLCRDECPAGVDVSNLMLEAKAAYVENNGLPPSDWAFSRVELWSRVASRLPLLSNALLASAPARWLMERFFGLSRLRRLPRVHRTPFVRRAARLGLNKPRPHAPGPRVVYFVDIFANYYDQELAEAVVGVLHHAEVNVYVPTAQRGSGMPALVVGDVEHARDLALANLRVLGEAVRDGYTVVCSEPTAALMLRQEYLKLTDDLDASLVAENTRELGHYLAGLQERGQLPRPEHPLHARVGYHQPCHLRALGEGSPGLELIRKIPELDVEFIDRGCSGMAGTFGLSRANFLTSLRAGRGLLSRLKESDIEIGATECGACRIQMEHGVRKRTLHPVKLLSLSYGLNPWLRQHFKDPKPANAIT